MTKRTVPVLAERAESYLVSRARETTEPVTSGELARALVREGEPQVMQRSVGPVLQHVAAYGSVSWSRNLVAWVVDEKTGEPSEHVSGLGDAAEVRATTHRRLSTGVWG
ncbi:hypothetical protein INN71_06530 [Nocardioides sp. ChNu-153]|uniref:hypothetical protein n=1 Tax=unclassified Nocardioides TaxID=2615069 RepID=UPI002405F390|nr:MULTISPECIES: hypothetical protein [unclassified Nocardioides]MDF9715178.1 hypothetical protein [Nocardioides sp. ChNu-99]MDN7121043.1 hypothetical protein [Nocardioides sp. ChNu-153]